LCLAWLLDLCVKVEWNWDDVCTLS
jgi:hypothetical protein